MKSGSRFFPVTALCLVAAGHLVTAGAQSTNGPGSNLLPPNQQEIELAARFSLLKELTTEHRARAEEAEKMGLPDKARWESDLTKELSTKVDQTAVQLDEAIRQRMAAGAKKSPGAIVKPESLDKDELAYLTRVDTELWRIEQELKAAIEVGNSFSAQMQTNNTPEDILRISYEVQENSTLRRYLSRERSDLELRQLEYRALKKN